MAGTTLAGAMQAASKQNKIAALATYRQLLRATRLAFEGDYQTLYNARSFARESFNQNRGLEGGSIEAAQAIEHAQGVTQILRENIVQGASSGPGDTFKLRLHEHTERGDNDTIRKLKGTSKSFASMKN
ncbi:Mitochondrial zinc maintenance protein 1, mitochondrial [Zalaria obscura]|uniref:Mitochondrial zinc maintenance protein 1, mitochondrial n=1 Tax=Zalaria obscura TaxID=2024903 RepID=A0ACC3S3A6_9PEZI